MVVVPPFPVWRRDPAGKARLDELGIRYALLEELPPRLTGWGVALCHGEFLSSGMAGEARRRGLRLAWSNEMTCLFPAECGALLLGLCDVILYVSFAQRQALEPQYRRLLSGDIQLPAFTGRADEVEGYFHESGRKLRWVMTGNYIDPDEFPFSDRTAAARTDQRLTVGRLSRADPAKFPPDFPSFYEGLELRNPRFRVMGWTRQLAAKWPAHIFDQRWELLAPLAEPASQFLQSLDLFVYSLHPSCRESWGRAVVEAMLTGAVPLVPAGNEHHLRSLVTHGETGFHCADVKEYGRYARLLEDDPELRRQLSRQARVRAARELCDAEQHREAWRRLFLAHN
jgi:glycosyltransferase involved in cell wall biosynthesis